MKKKILIFCLFGAALTSAFAELYPSKRIFEVGASVDVEATENLMPVTEVLQKELVIDLNKIYEGMGDDGFVLTAGITPSMFFNLDLGPVGAGLNLDMSLSSSLGISREFFRLLAEGNEIGTESTTKLNVSLDSFLALSAPVEFGLGKLKLHVTPSLFVPVLYIPNPDATVSVLMNEDGTMRATANAPLAVYSLVSGEGIVTQEGISPDVSSALAEMDIASTLMSSAGVDIGARAEMELWKGLDVGAYASIPLVPGHLKNKISTTASVSVDVDSIMSVALSGDDQESEPYRVSDAPYYSEPVFEAADYAVNRPFRLGVEAAWRPVGNWLTLRPRVGIAARNPFGEDFSMESVYGEYSFGAEATLLYFLGLSAKTEYTDRIFAQSLGLSFNMRIFELDLGLSTSSADFFKSFQISGLQALVAVKVGF